MDRNFDAVQIVIIVVESLSARRAWIEIHFMPKIGTLRSVALRKESVDRNQRIAKPFREQFKVALRKESVDRNLWWGVRKAVGSLVALRKESVDRNRSSIKCAICRIKSLSARRAWIEIIKKGRARRPGQSRSPQGERG